MLLSSCRNITNKTVIRTNFEKNNPQFTIFDTLYEQLSIDTNIKIMTKTIEAEIRQITDADKQSNSPS